MKFVFIGVSHPRPYPLLWYGARVRIVSLIASSTEIVCALGFESQLVGRSHECDYPPSVKKLPSCTEPKFKVDGPSSKIDERVKEIVREGLSVYRVFPEHLKELRPDVIVTQIQCEVCAVSERDVQEALSGWSGYKPQVVSLNPNALDDLWRDIQRVAVALGAPARGAQLISELKDRLNDISRKAHAPIERPTVACIEWIDPLMAAGNWMPELVELAGGVNLFGEAGKHSPWMTWDGLLEKDADVIVVLPCGFDIARTREEMHLLTKNPLWRNLSAVQNRRVCIADGNQYFNRPGPRLVESLEILAEIFHPDHFKPRHEGEGWVRFEG